MGTYSLCIRKLDDDDWSLMSDISMVLHPIVNLIYTIEGDNVPVSVVFVSIHSLIDELNNTFTHTTHGNILRLWITMDIKRRWMVGTNALFVKNDIYLLSAMLDYNEIVYLEIEEYNRGVIILEKIF